MEGKLILEMIRLTPNSPLDCGVFLLVLMIFQNDPTFQMKVK